MSKRGKSTANKVIALAYLHRYGWIALTLGVLIIWPEYMFYFFSIDYIAFSIWSLVGYRHKWRHIYCSYQNANRQTMTPHSIHWNQMKKSDAYGVPLIFLILGLAFLFVEILL